MDEQLKKEVKILISQGYNEAQIKEAMTQKGYTISQIQEAIISKDEDVKKGSNWKKIVIVIVILLFILTILLYFLWPKSIPFEEKITYSNYAPDWIEKINNSNYDNKTLEIDVVAASEGRASFIGDQERYIDVDESIISLFYGGSYNGNIFNNRYYDSNEKIKMRIGDSINPLDNIIEGFGIFKKEDDNFVIYLFIDEDWKIKSNGNINIIWGNNITDKNNLNYEKFDFSNEKNGVYIHKITKDVSWFVNQNPVIGRLFFGEITLDDIKQSNYNKTFIALT